LRRGSTAAEARAAAENSGWDIPNDYVAERSDNDEGWIFRAPGTTGNASIIKVMERCKLYSRGYVRMYNEYAQPIDAEGYPGSNADTHFPLGGDDDIDPEIDPT
jgi:hypothetical protein